MIDENEILAKSDNPRKIYIQEIMPQKIAFAVKYVKGRSFIEDIIIIFTTFIKIIRR
jgi:lipopolysaccharide/colanic/teichoic acid biosynthesis glycosyltransferase